MGDALDPDRVASMATLLAGAGGFKPLWSGRRATMFVEGAGIAHNHGAIAGFVCRRGASDPLERFESADASLLHAGRGQFLVDAHWGGYVALTERDDEVCVLRAPLGDLGCLYAEAAGMHLIASDTALLERAGAQTAIDHDAVARHLAAPDLRRPETCLAGVRELQGGLRLDIGASGPSVTEAWSPWEFAVPERQLSDPEEAQARLHDAICHAVRLSARPHGRVILRLSGGLDSSIVAAALKRGNVDTVALNLVTEDLSGDERHYARLTANSLGIELVERLRKLDAVDLDSSLAASLPRPSGRAFTQAALAHANALAAETGAGAIIDGGGGDNVFCSLQSIRPVIDCMVAGQGWRMARATARSVAALTQASEWTVLHRALLGRARRLSRYTLPLDRRLLSEAAIDAAAGAADHRWLGAPPGALPGKAAHIGLIAPAQSVVESFPPLDSPPLLSPLISQPVVEACLMIPSWHWFDDGHNRAAARRAFVKDLPSTIVWRRSKGGPDGFIAELFRRQRAHIRERLLDGRLMRAGLLDRDALISGLDGQGPVQGQSFVRLMQLLDAEIWTRSRDP